MTEQTAVADGDYFEVGKEGALKPVAWSMVASGWVDREGPLPEKHTATMYPEHTILRWRPSLGFTAVGTNMGTAPTLPEPEAVESLYADQQADAADVEPLSLAERTFVQVFGMTPEQAVEQAKRETTPDPNPKVFTPPPLPEGITRVVSLDEHEREVDEAAKVPHVRGSFLRTPPPVVEHPEHEVPAPGWQDVGPGEREGLAWATPPLPGETPRENEERFFREHPLPAMPTPFLDDAIAEADKEPTIAEQVRYARKLLGRIEARLAQQAEIDAWQYPTDPRRFTCTEAGGLARMPDGTTIIKVPPESGVTDDAALVCTDRTGAVIFAGTHRLSRGIWMVSDGHATTTATVSW